MESRQLLRKTKQILVDGSTVCRQTASCWRGLGFVTGNGSSRLLMDYALLHPDVYEEIIRLLFAPGYGAGLTHIKVELGADINSSSGTEPCTMRTADEPADVTRGAGFRLAADAKRINPAVTADLLRWGEPHWVTRAFENGKEAGFQARYRWYKETLTAAFNTYGLTFDFISPDANETGQADTEWLIYFAEHLKHEPDAPYDFSRIRLVASDEVGTRTIAEQMLQNEALRDAIDVIGLHYTTYGDENTRQLHDEYNKEIWYSEGAAPCSIPSLANRIDGSGLSGDNGPIDIANRIIGCFPHGQMVMYEFQPAVNAYYNGSCYAPKQLITANEPWSGQYSVDIGLWVARHFTKFTDPGWMFAESACFGDGEENHVIRNTTNNYTTLISPDGKDLTMVLTNDSAAPRSYLVVIKNLPELREKAYVIETVGNPNPDLADVDWFKATEKLRLSGVDGEIAFPLVVKPYSIMTVTTMGERIGALYGDEELAADIPGRKRLTFPYRDTFAYDREAIAARGGMPLYLTDQGGAFEIISTETDSWLEQKITKDALPTNWRFRGTPEPITCFGDDLWANYQAVTEVVFGDASPDNYVGVGIRYNSAVTCPKTSCCGPHFRLYADGTWELRYMDELLSSGSVPEFRYDAAHKIGIGALGTLVMCFADGHSLYEVKLDGRAQVRSGRASLSSAYYRNRFLSVSAERMQLPLPIPAYVYRLDALSPYVRFDENAENGWLLRGMAEYQNYNRTCAEGVTGSALQIRFYGTGIYLLGKTNYAACCLWIDGTLYSEEHVVQGSNYREAFLAIEPLHKGWHTLSLEVTDGKLCFDAFEIPTDDESPDYDVDFPADPLSAENTPAKRSPLDLKKAAIPLANAAATGLAVAFTVGQIGRKLRKMQKRKKR